MQTKLSMEEIYGKNINVCRLSSLQKLDKVILANVSKHEPLFMGVHESHFFCRPEKFLSCPRKKFSEIP